MHRKYDTEYAYSMKSRIQSYDMARMTVCFIMCFFYWNGYGRVEPTMGPPIQTKYDFDRAYRIDFFHFMSLYHNVA